MADMLKLARRLDELFDSAPVVQKVEINKNGMAKVEMTQEAFEDADDYDDVPVLIPERVIFQPPATIVYWPDGDKTVVRCENDEFSEEFGYAMACMRKMYGTRAAFKSMFKDAYRPALKEKKKKKRQTDSNTATGVADRKDRPLVTLDGQISRFVSDER